MAVRNKTGNRKLSKTTKPKRRTRAKNANGGTPSDSVAAAIESRASPVVMISEMIEPSCEDDEDLGSPAIPADSRRRSTVVASSSRRASMMSSASGRRSVVVTTQQQQRVDSDESHSTINSLLASPCPMGEDEVDEDEECELSQFTVDHDDGVDDDDVAAARTPRGGGGGIFSRIFRGIFGSKGGQVSSAVPPIATDLNDTPAIYEVIHVFPDPRAASGHEGLMIRSRARLERMGCADSADLARFPQSVPVSQMPAEDKVVLLRRVISPRAMNQSSANATDEEIIDKASHRPELWLFVTYEECRKHYSKELCDYYNYRVVHRGSEMFQSQQSEDEEMEDDGGQLLQQHDEETPEQFFSTNLIHSANGGAGVLETPLQEDIENTLPPNSVEAPLKEHPCPMMEGVTPIILPTPPQITNKSQDLGL